MTKRPSANPDLCGKCHDRIAGTYKKSLHFTAEGLRTGVSGRFSAHEKKIFDNRVFESSCRSCHASCGECHVASPKIAGVTTGLLRGHQFVKQDDGKTCARCHGGRVYPEFTGDFGGQADVHYQKGMTCLNCHKKEELHGTGTAYTSKTDVKEKPACTQCHAPGAEKTEKSRESHSLHREKLSCYACHSAGSYNNCYDCHLGKGATSKPGFSIGLNPKDKKTVTTLRITPVARDTFASAGITMQNYDLVPNYRATATHNIKKRTDRTRSCGTCHTEKKDFLTREGLIKDGSKANYLLLYTPGPLNR